MRWTLGLGFLIAVTVAEAQVPMNLYSKTRKVGEATYTLAVDSAGKTTTLDTYMGPVHERESTRVDLWGQPTRVEIEQYAGKSTQPTTRIVFTFDAKGNATGRTYASGVLAGEKQIPFPRRGSRKDVSEYWFVKERPSPGTWSQFYMLDVHSGKWDLTKTTFIGKKPVQAGGKTVMANKLTQIRSTGTLTVWLDDRGNPVRIDTAQARLERRW